MLNLVFDIKSLLFAFTTLKFWALKAIEGKRSKIGVKEVTDSKMHRNTCFLMSDPFMASHICSGCAPTEAAELTFERALR